MFVGKNTARQIKSLLNQSRRREQSRGLAVSDVQYAPRIVRVRKVGGAAGSATTNCTFTYDFWYKGSTGTSDPLNSAPQQPTRPRYPNCQYSPPPDDSEGLAYFDESGWHLLDVYQEFPLSEECE